MTPLVEQVHQTQHLRHLIANKLTLPLVVLRDLQVGKLVNPTLIQRAIRDLAAIERFVSKETDKEELEEYLSVRNTTPSGERD